MADDTTQDTSATDEAPPAQEEAAAEPEAPPPAAEAQLGEGGKAALAAERSAKRAAEKRAKEAEARLKALEDEKLSETEKLKKQAEDDRARAAGAEQKLRRANLLAALADQGIVGAKAKAAARLLDGVEYDDQDEPTNLDDALQAAKAEYGDDVFKGAKPAPPSTDAREGDTERLPELTAEEVAFAQKAGMTPERYAQFKTVESIADLASITNK